MTDDIREWLVNLGLGEHIEAFVENEVDQALPPELNIGCFNSIAVETGYTDAQQAQDMLIKRMNLDQIAEAQRMAREWMEKHQRLWMRLESAGNAS